MSFLGELRRRNVVRVGVAYLVVAWLVIEVSSTVFPALSLPDWGVPMVTVLLILGFPFALIFSWAFELTPEGLKKSHEVDSTESITRVTGRKLDFAIIGALVLALGFVVYNYVLEDADGRLPNSIAVLPFENLSPDPDNAYFAAGIHEEILNQLAKLSALNVIARTSMLRYAATDKSIPEIAEELNVETVMEGSVRYAGDRVRITAQLIDPDTGAHLWTEAYERDFADIFGIQADIAMNIANALEAEFSLAEQESIEEIPTGSREAYQLYLRARPLPDASSDIAHTYLDEAIKLDKDFALAYAEKARRHVREMAGLAGAAGMSPMATTELAQLTRVNVEAALELDPDLAGAHATLADLNRFEHRWDEAQDAFDRALQLRPNDVEILGVYIRFLAGQRKFEEAIELEQHRRSLIPVEEGLGFGQLGLIYWRSGDLDAAAEEAYRARELNPNGVMPDLGVLEAIRGNTEQALVFLQRADRLPVANRLPSLARLAYGFGRVGRPQDAQRLFEELEEIAATGQPVGNGHWVVANLAIENYDEALVWLTRAAEATSADNGTLNLVMTRDNAWQDPALQEPRFQEVLDRIVM